MPLLLFLALLCPVAAEETEGGEETKQFLEELQSVLPDAARPHLPSDPTDAESLRETVGFRHLLSMAVEALQNGFSAGRQSLVRLIGITLLFSAAAAVAKGRGTSLVIELGATLALYSTLSGCGERMACFFSDLSAFSSALSPLYTAALAGGGAVSGAAAAGGAFTAFVTVLDVMATGLLAPLLRVLTALTLLSALSGGGAVGELSGRITGVYLWMLSLLGVLLTAALAFEGSLASSLDSMAVRTVKFALGNAVPVVGGTVSSLLGSLQASVALIKSAMGATSLVVLFALLLPLLCELLLLRTALSLCEGVAALLNAAALGGVLGRFRRLYDLMLAGSVLTSVLFLVTVGMVSRGGAIA